MLLKAPYKAWTTYSYKGMLFSFTYIFFLDFTLWIVIPKNKNHEQDPFWKF